MVVNHYVVSAVQVAGLVVGLYGFFLLSIPIFGTGSAKWITAFLPAPATAIYCYFVISLMGELFSAIGYIHVGFFTFGMVGWERAAPLGLLAGFAFGYLTHLDNSSRSLNATVQRALIRRSLVVVGVGLLGLLIFDSLTLVFAAPFSVSPVFIQLNLLVIFAAIFGVLEGAVLRALDDQGLLKVGVVLSGLAILTQFIPPVLDLLNIH